METKRIVEILTNVVNNIETNHIDCNSGICKALGIEYYFKRITLIESNFIEAYLYRNQPTPYNEYKEFTQGEYWTDELYWWNRMEDYPQTRQIRIDYLNKLIANVK